MKRENYIITVKSIYIRNAEMFCPESMTEQEILNLDDIDIFQSCEFERYWKNAEVSAYLCQMACAEEECEKELQKIAEHFKIPACFLNILYDFCPLFFSFNNIKRHHKMINEYAVSIIAVTGFKIIKIFFVFL